MSFCGPKAGSTEYCRTHYDELKIKVLHFLSFHEIKDSDWLIFLRLMRYVCIPTFTKSITSILQFRTQPLHVSYYIEYIYIECEIMNI